MKTLLNWMRQACSTASDGEWTMHDALRLCGRGDTAGPARMDVCLYASESDLAAQWRQRDVASPVRWNAVLVLGEQLTGSLRGLLRRRHPGARLILVPAAGAWPGIDSPVDLMLATVSLGWTSIEVCRDLRQALDQSLSAREGDDRVVVFWPSPLETWALLPERSREESRRIL